MTRCTTFWPGATERLETCSHFGISLGSSLRVAASRFNRGLSLPEGAINLIRNPRLGDGTTGFLKNWGSEPSLSVLDGDGPLGQTHLLRVVTSFDHAAEGSVYGVAGQLGVAAGIPHTASIYVRGSGTIRARISFNSGGGGASGPDHTLTGQWERLTVTATPTVNTVALAILETTSAQVATIESGAWQFEASPHATAYLDGSMGAGFSWAGTPDQSVSLRQAGRISMPAPVVSLVHGGLALWWRPDHAYDFTRDRVLLHIPTTEAPLQLRHVVATNRFRLASPAGDTVEVDAPSFEAGTDFLISAGWTRDTLSVGVGEAVSDAPRTAGPWLAAGPIDLGSTGEATPATGLHADGAIGPAWWFDGPPSVATLEVLARTATLPQLVLS